MDVNLWISNPKVIQKSQKGYTHFDIRTDISKVSEYITNPEKVAHHGFYPFIHYVMKVKKYNKRNGKTVKERDICYAAHLDRCIYQYYSALLNENYNLFLKKEGLNEVPVAYRTNIHKSNIHVAKEVFDFICKQDGAYVLIGDFTGFFDNLEHQYLKKNWCTIMNFDYLPPDHYNVFKNITKYSIWELEDLLEITGLRLNEFNKRSVALNKSTYRKNKKHIKKNTKPYQIPQGSPISAVLANIYMIEADKAVNNYVISLGGMYRRYSDDFIVVVPKKRTELSALQNIIDILTKIPNLNLEPNKTQVFSVEDTFVKNIGNKLFDNADISKSTINFLGFNYDGKNITVRSKTISKYYNRMYRKAKVIAKNSQLKGADDIYKKYSIHGAFTKSGNFFTYIKHSEDIFGEKQSIDRDLKNHIPKIRKALKKNLKKNM